jgi:gamma-glutamylputrescine oxidase
VELSYWEKQTYFSKVDLLIIGSGIVGLNAAIHYKSKYPKAKVLVLERGLLPLGASTKNAGFACFGSVSELADDLSRMPEDTVWETVKLRNDGLKKLRRLVGDKNMDYRPLGGFEVFDDAAEFERCAALIEPFNKKMQSVLRLKKVYSAVNKKISASGFRGFRFCVANRYEGQINTGMMMRTLLGLAQRAGIMIVNGLEADKLTDAQKSVDVLLKNGFAFTARRVIVATNGFARQLLPQLDVRPARAQVLVTAPIKNLKVKGAFHYQQGYYYFRNIDGRVLLGGGRNLDFGGEETPAFGLTEKIQQRLEAILAGQILPGVAYTVEQRWSGIMGVGSEKKPIITHISNNIVCAVRMGGMGVAIGSMVGEMAVKELTK